MKPQELYNLTTKLIYKNVGDDVDYLCFVKDGIIYLYFESSRTKRDWQNNFNFPRKIYKKQDSCLKVARGWGDAYKSCNDLIMKELIELTEDYPFCPVVIVGHSYGGAMAVLAAEDLHYRTHIMPSVITFGAPKSLFGKNSKKYVESCCAEIVQYQHVHDIVPRLPPFTGYYNVNPKWVGTERWKIWKTFKPSYHISYGDEKLYKDFLKSAEE